MKWFDSHLSDQQLLSEADGELSAREARRAQGHLAACWACRARKQEMEGTIAEFVRVHQEQALPDAAGPTALLRARLAEEVGGGARLRWSLAAAAAVCVVAAVGTMILLSGRTGGRESVAVAVPDANLTPGATVLVSRGEVCRAARENNRAVPVTLARRVLEEYGIGSAEPRGYEVDYLITPALGGADDIHNLWPQSYQAVWNARVKDALEDRLRMMVCDGELDLTTAQTEISRDWIGAYKKYFHTEMPLSEQ